MYRTPAAFSKPLCYPSIFSPFSRSSCLRVVPLRSIAHNRLVASTQDSIKQAVREIEEYVASFGWDAPVRVFALVQAARALELHPDLESDLPADVSLESAHDPESLFSVEQEGLPEADSIEELLAQLAWPDEIVGAAISCERITLPPDAEADLPADPDLIEDFLAHDPRREDVRMVVGVLRTGEAWCALRMKSHDAVADVLQSADLVPELVEQVRATFA